MNIFKPEDFGAVNGFWSREQISALANAKLNKLIESWPVVYGDARRGEWHISNDGKGYSDTPFKARLAFIEELAKEPCKHEPMPDINSYNYPEINGTCRNCGIELVAHWEAK